MSNEKLSVMEKLDLLNEYLKSRGIETDMIAEIQNDVWRMRNTIALLKSKIERFEKERYYDNLTYHIVLRPIRLNSGWGHLDNIMLESLLVTHDLI